ncbi:unnamed protein product [Adineta steineri]|uniref:Twitchin n=1 Tax=Adineta steineri TaxID=433720 RepID=A0A814MHN0_9BILA|nr:unnamed protein product [Adineta steineri]CAF1079096.1 unnamed protein product [Adineta steineri]
MVILNEGNVYKLKLKSIGLKDAGKIAFQCDECDIDVIVLDNRGVPEGPLQTTDTKRDSVSLQWKPPKENGGSDVTAENIYGIGEPLETTSAITVKPPYDAPDAPGTPECIGHTSESITLQWTRSQIDGGNPIRGYLIEKKEKGTDRWILVNREPVAGAEYTVSGLADGKEYEFRVAAVNRADPGEYAKTEGPNQARPPDVAPHDIDFSAFSPKEIIVRAAEDFKITVPFVGVPAPQVTFTQNGNKIKPDGNNQVTVKDGIAELIVSKVKGGDTGLYSCTLKNYLGQETAQMKVIVVDKLDTPEGPLNISNVKPDSCLLTWKPSKPDGGSPITNYTIEKFDTKKGEWQKVSSFCRSLFYKVTGLNEDMEPKTDSNNFLKYFAGFVHLYETLKDPPMSTGMIINLFFSVPLVPYSFDKRMKVSNPKFLTIGVSCM